MQVLVRSADARGGGTTPAIYVGFCAQYARVRETTAMMSEIQARTKLAVSVKTQLLRAVNKVAVNAGVNTIKTRAGYRANKLGTQAGGTQRGTHGKHAKG